MGVVNDILTEGLTDLGQSLAIVLPIVGFILLIVLLVTLMRACDEFNNGDGVIFCLFAIVGVSILFLYYLSYVFDF